MAQNIDIGLYDSINRLYLSANKDFEIKDLDKKITLLKKKSNDIVLFRSSPETANFLVIASAPDLTSSSSKLSIECISNKENQSEPCLIQIKNSQNDPNKYNKFRGSIIINPRKSEFGLINRLDIEDYLLSVVPSEMQASWPLEALKAQAVAARTYTLAKMGRRKNLGYDLKPSVEDQMYLGFNREEPLSNKAVIETKGEFLIDKQGNYVEAYYSAHGALFSAMPEYGWGISPKHYLISDEEPSHDKRSWQRSYSIAELQSKLSDLQFSKITGLNILERSPEGRVHKIMLSGILTKSNKSHNRTLTGEEFRHHFALPSSYFTIKQNQSSISLEGFGFGHGVGMSQYGAKALASKDKNYQEILGYFYKKSRLAELE